jgi:predicted extracellular nuclease
MRVRRTVAIASAAATTVALVALVPGTASATPSDLFISEYIEGSSNNKAIEVFNGTGGAVNLATDAYQIEMYFNGSQTAGLTIPLTGAVANGDVYVVAQALAGAPILAQADQTSGAGWFNGDDTVVLRKGGSGGPLWTQSDRQASTQAPNGAPGWSARPTTRCGASPP